MDRDFRVRDEGTLVLLEPLSDAAREWVAEYLPEDASRFGAAVVIEWRFTRDILDGIADAQLTVEKAYVP